MNILSSTKGVSKQRTPMRSGARPARRSPVRSGSRRVNSALPLAALAVPAVAGAVGGALTSSADIGVEETFFAPEDVAQIVADQVSQAMGEDTNTTVAEDGDVLFVITTDANGAEIAKTDIENVPDNEVEVTSSAKRGVRGARRSPPRRRTR